MKPLRNLFYIKADKQRNQEIDFNGGKLFLETAFEPYQHAVQDGEVFRSPMKIEGPFRNDLEIQEGDKVYFHHFVVQPDNFDTLDEQELFRCDYSSIYAVERGEKITTIENYVFVSPILEDESNYKTKSGIWIKPNAENIPLHGIVEHTNPYLESVGVTTGAHVIFTPSSEYEMKLAGKKVYRMKLQDLAAIVLEKEVVPFEDSLIVKIEKPKEKIHNGIILVDLDSEKTAKLGSGFVIKSNVYDINPNDKVIFLKKRAVTFEFENEEFALVYEKDLMAIETF